MVREVSGYLFLDPPDILKDPYIVLDTDKEGNLIFFKKWGSLKHIPKKEIRYFEDLLQKASQGRVEGLNECDIVLLLLMTSRIYSAVSQRYHRKGCKIFTNFYILDIFNEVLMLFLSLLREGKTREDIYVWEKTGWRSFKNPIESKIIENLLNFLKYQKSYESSYEVFVESCTED